MPTSDGAWYCFKYVNGHPANLARGLQTVTAFGMLADVHNGYPTFISEMTLLTALRTAAASPMAARALARPDAQTMAMIGTGSQSEFQALAFRAVPDIRRLRIWDTDPAAMEKFVRNVGKTELDPEILRRSDIFVEFTEQTRIEGEIQPVDPDFPVTELWQVLTGSAQGRTSAEQITVFDSVGFAIEDFSALRDAVDGTDYYDEIDLIADPVDPKDLFSLVRALAPVPVGS